MKQGILIIALSALLWVSPAAGELPLEPSLTETLTGELTTVHYTLTGSNAAPDLAFVQLVQEEMELAITVLGNEFRPPIPEGPAGERRLHVFIKDLGNSLGQMVGNATGGSKQARSFMRIHAQFAAIAGPTWQAKLSDICVHETMHGVQNAYNAFVSSWVKEGQATWAEGQFNGSFESLAEFLALPNSVARRPELPLWDTTSFHHYSTALFIHHLVSAKGVSIIAQWLKATEGSDDGQAALQKVLGGNGKVFGGIYRKYLLRLFQKNFPGIDSGIIPDVPEDPVITKLGETVDGSVVPTGAIFRRVVPDDRIPNSYLFARVVEADTGAPEMLVIKSPTANSPVKTVKPPEIYEIAGFKSAPETLLILTDVSAASEGSGATTIDGEVLSPFIEFTEIMVDSPITEGETSDIRITYNLIGTPPSPPIFLVDRKVIEKRSNVIDRATDEVLFFTGEDRVHNLIFRTFPGTPGGSYKFKFGGSTPGKSYSKKKLSTSETSIRTEIIVNGSSARAWQDASDGGAPVLAEP